MTQAVLLALFLFQVTLVAPDPGKGGGDLLPQQFSGWTAQQTQKFSQAGLEEMAGADAALLREFGIWGAERKEYSQAGKRITVEALRMQDSSAAYGAFTFYRQADWRTEAGAGFHYAVGGGQTVLVRNGFCVRIVGEIAPQNLSALAAALPTHRQEALPQMREFLPEKGAVGSSLKYVLGPKAAQRMIPEIPPALLAFDKGAEVETARYELPGKPPMTLVLAMYPTPQIATQRIKALGEQSQIRFFRRTGALITMVLDAQSQTDANALLDSVKYEMSVSWNEAVPKTPPPTVSDFVKMVLAIMKLAGILIAFCFVSGLLFAGARIAGKRYFPGTVFDRDIEIIQLHLTN